MDSKITRGRKKEDVFWEWVFCYQMEIFNFIWVCLFTFPFWALIEIFAKKKKKKKTRRRVRTQYHEQHVFVFFSFFLPARSQFLKDKNKIRAYKIL